MYTIQRLVFGPVQWWSRSGGKPPFFCLFPQFYILDILLYTSQSEYLHRIMVPGGGGGSWTCAVVLSGGKPRGSLGLRQQQGTAANQPSIVSTRLPNRVPDSLFVLGVFFFVLSFSPSTPYSVYLVLPVCTRDL